MFVFEFKCLGKPAQYTAIDSAIRTSQFVRNKCLRYWMENIGVNGCDLNKYTARLAKEFPFANKLNSTARQASAVGEACAKRIRCWTGITKFFDNCKKKIPGKKGFPKFSDKSIEVNGIYF